MERPRARVNSSASASTRITAKPPMSAAVMAWPRSEALCPITEAISPCSTACRLATRYADPLAASVKAGFSVAGPPSSASVMACCTCACAWSACAEDRSLS